MLRYETKLIGYKIWTILSIWNKIQNTPSPAPWHYGGCTMNISDGTLFSNYSLLFLLDITSSYCVITWSAKTRYTDSRQLTFDLMATNVSQKFKNRTWILAIIFSQIFHFFNVILSYHYSDVKRASWHLRLLATRLFVLDLKWSTMMWKLGQSDFQVY